MTSKDGAVKVTFYSIGVDAYIPHVGDVLETETTEGTAQCEIVSIDRDASVDVLRYLSELGGQRRNDA